MNYKTLFFVLFAVVVAFAAFVFYASNEGRIIWDFSGEVDKFVRTVVEEDATEPE